MATAITLMSIAGAVYAAPSMSSATIKSAEVSDPKLDEKTARIRELERYYADIYGEPLREKNRLAQLVAIVSLSRIDGAAITAKLLEAMASSDVLVAQLAWDAISGRHASLDDAQRAAWITGGLEIAKRGGFPGATVAPLLDAAATRPLAKLKDLPDAVLTRVLETNDPATPDGKPAIEAAGRAIAAWGDARLAQAYIAKLSGKPAMAGRVAAMLAMLPGAPAAGSDATATRSAWAKWSRETKLSPPATQPTFTPTALLLPPAQPILDPDDPKWRRELELAKLNLDAVELAFCIDATGSMADSNEFVIAYVETIARMLRVMSDKVKVGTVYYRHEIDPSVMLDCCRTMEASPKHFHTKTIPLMPDATALIQQMSAQKPPGKNERGVGHNRLGAYTGAIQTAMQGLQWAKKGTKIIACTGDAKPTTNSEAVMVNVARAAKDNGYLLMFLVEGPTTAGQVAPASRAATGLEPLVYKNDIAKLEVDKAKANAQGMTAAIDRFKGSAFEAMTVRVLELTLPNDYRDRVKPLMNAVLPILAAQDSADRAAKLLNAR